MVVRGRIVARGMLREGTPVDDYRREYGLLVKREDLACVRPGPQFSKTRGVYARVASREEQLIGVLDTSHSQAGWAVARACQILGKQCVNYYPHYKADKGLREPQQQAQALGAKLHALPAGRSCILYHAARKLTEEAGGYMMPNALKLEESINETAQETIGIAAPDFVIVPASSGTIAAGVIRGFGSAPTYLIHLGYSRPLEAVRRYLSDASGVVAPKLEIIDEKYSYRDAARPGPTPPWPCNVYYDLKAFRWWMQSRETAPRAGSVLFWNIG